MKPFTLYRIGLLSQAGFPIMFDRSYGSREEAQAVAETAGATHIFRTDIALEVARRTPSAPWGPTTEFDDWLDEVNEELEDQVGPVRGLEDLKYHTYYNMGCTPAAMVQIIRRGHGI